MARVGLWGTPIFPANRHDRPNVSSYYYIALHDLYVARSRCWRSELPPNIPGYPRLHPVPNTRTRCLICLLKG
ncbi:hypothetical protein HZ326_24508 [Fusarium oxysporum f. sp. albedinis]|nr:Vegetative incompatibility protein HET-E-1 [Fusarium oxysporum f. sp. albedinis]KAJ0132421.1 hypothetical protein HZ326_24508 [Fusarium oxysporum f. sp. albedinis]